MPAPPFLLKPSFCLQYGFSYCGDHIPCSCLVPGRARRGILNPEGRGTPQPRWWWGIRIPAVQCDLRQEHPTILLFSLSSLCSFWGFASQLIPAHDLLSIPLASGRGSLLLPCPLRALHILFCCPWSPGPSLFCQGYCPLPFEPGTAPSHLLPALLHPGILGMSRAKGACTGAGSLGG